MMSLKDEFVKSWNLVFVAEIHVWVGTLVPGQTWGRALIWAPCPGTGASSRGSAQAPYTGTGGNLNRFSSVPTVFTFSQAV